MRPLAELFIILGTALVLVLMFMAVAGTRYRCAESKLVVKVGGCDRWGDCGALFEDGSYSYAHKPVEGARYCTRTEVVHQWPWSKP